MKIINKQTCPTCGQTINEVEIVLVAPMVKALVRVFDWCSQNNQWEFRRKDILKNDIEIARFGDLRYFGDLVRKPKKGSYKISHARTLAFLRGELSIPTKVYKKTRSPFVHIDTKSFRTISEVPKLGEVLDEDMEIIVRYK